MHRQQQNTDIQCRNQTGLQKKRLETSSPEPQDDGGWKTSLQTAKHERRKTAGYIDVQEPLGSCPEFHTGPERSHSRRTVQSDTAFYLSPSKNTHRIAPKRSPTSVFDIEAYLSPESKTVSEKKLNVSMSSIEKSVLQQFSGFDSSKSLHLSGTFDVDSFEQEASQGVVELEEFSLDSGDGTVPRIFDISNVSCNSDLSCSIGQLSRGPSFRFKKQSAWGPPSVSNTAAASDSVPMMPIRQESSDEFKLETSVPVQIDCPSDMSPTKPSRQLSRRQLMSRQPSQAATMVSMLTTDSSPRRPTRQLSQSLLGASCADTIGSALSYDTSPSKPLRKKSVRSLFADDQSTMSRGGLSGRGVPSRRTINRSEKSATSLRTRPSRRALLRRIPNDTGGLSVSVHERIVEEN